MHAQRNYKKRERQIDAKELKRERDKRPTNKQKREKNRTTTTTKKHTHIYQLGEKHKNSTRNQIVYLHAKIRQSMFEKQKNRLPTKNANQTK